MATQYNKVIVFGPTGSVGGATALEASKRGADVWLAMRDTGKTISAITKEQEQQASFTRVQADLTDAESVKRTVQQSGAKAAYIYLVPGMQGSIPAMKEAGIEYVVFLSTSTVQRDQDLRQISHAELIPYMHAQIEIALEDAGLPHVALRAGYFASNSIRMNLDTSKRPYEAKVTHSHIVGDCISPEDIGRVGGAVLVNRPSPASKEAIYLWGPQLLTIDQQWDIVKKVSGQEIDVIHQTPEEYTQTMIAKGLPPPLVNYLVEAMGKSNSKFGYPEQLYKQYVANIKKYSGYEPTTFEEYVRTQNLG